MKEHATMFGEYTSYAEALAALLQDQAARSVLKERVVTDNLRDPVDALHDAQLLQSLQAMRVAEVRRQSAAEEKQLQNDQFREEGSVMKNIDLLGEPPTAAEIEVAKDAAVRAEQGHQKRFWFALAGVGLLGGGYVLIAVRQGASAAGTLSFGACAAFIIVMLIRFWNPNFHAHQLDTMRRFEAINTESAKTVVIKTCLLDPRVDLYRRKVVAQGRDLINLEAEAFHQWEKEGFAADKRTRLLRTDGPILDEQSVQWRKEGE